MLRRLFLATSALGLPAAHCLAATADEHWFIFLETGRPTPADREAVMAMQRAHIDNFKRLFAEGRLFAAGPLRDPSRVQRGIVTVRASSREELLSYFQPDPYVSDGYMQVNAVPAQVNRGLNTEGIDDSRVEEVRIVKISRPAAAADAATAAACRAVLQGLLERGVVGAWYTLRTGPVAEVLFARGTDSAALQAALAGLPGGGEVAVWPQWLSPGVVR